MAGSSPMWPRGDSARSVASIINQHHRIPPTRGICWQSPTRPIPQQRPTITLTNTHLPPTPPKSTSYYCRPFTSLSSLALPVPQKQPRPIDREDWENVSSEARIQRQGDDKWGWVVYRCSYAKEFDAAWEDFKHRTLDLLHKYIAESDAPGIVETMDFVFVEDSALEGASNEELQRRFQAWARTSYGDNHVDSRCTPQGSRYEFFLRVDSKTLRNRYVGLVMGWPYCKDGDWIKIRDDSVTPGLYEELNNPIM